MISGLGIPPGAQVTAQLSGTTPGGAGVYTLFLHGPSKIDGIIPTIPMTETYGVLTVGAASSGTVAVGEQVNDTASDVLPNTEIEAQLTANTWVVNRAQTVASEDMKMTGAPLAARYNTVNGQTVKTGYLVIQQDQFSNYSEASLTYAQGKAAHSLGLTQSAGAFLSSPGLIVLPGSCATGQSNCTSAAAFMNNLVAMDPDWSTFQTTYFPASAVPPGTPPALEAWAQSTDGQYTYLEGYSESTPPIVDSINPTDPMVERAFAPASATVPEPSTWAMILVGFAGLGFARYRPRRSTRPSGRSIGATHRASPESGPVR
jgi:hypothetical protein